MSESSKDLFFFSKFCEYSNNMLGVISKKGIQKNFHFVCIDNKTSKQLPPFVDRVPLIYTTRKDVLTDEFVSNYIETRYPSPAMRDMPLSQQQTIQQPQSSSGQDDGITPFMLGNALNSSQYTYITPDGNGYESSFDINSEMLHKNNFGMLGQDQVISGGGVAQPSDFSEKSTEKSEKFDSKLYEKMMEARSMDDDILKRKIMQGNNGF
jgi:hypothetical protein